MPFNESAPAEVVTANGVTASLQNGFILYQHGFNTARVIQTTSVRHQAGAEAELSIVEIAANDGCNGQVPPARPGLPSQTMLKRLTWWPLVRDAECRYRLPTGLLDSLVMQESKYDKSALSPARAGGLTQLMPGTALALGLTDRFDPAANVDGGARYLRAMLDRYSSVPFALAAYNAGPGAVDRSGGIPRNRETPGYVTRVLSYWTNGFSASSLTHYSSSASHATSLYFGLSSRN